MKIPLSCLGAVQSGFDLFFVNRFINENHEVFLFYEKHALKFLRKLKNIFQTRKNEKTK